MNLLVTLLEISDYEKVGRQLIIALDRVAPGKFKQRSDKTWKAVHPDDDDWMIWVADNHVMFRAPWNQEGFSFIKHVMSAIMGIDSFAGFNHFGRNHVQVTELNYPAAKQDIDGREYAMLDFSVDAKK